MKLTLKVITALDLPEGKSEAIVCLSDWLV